MQKGRGRVLILSTLIDSKMSTTLSSCRIFDDILYTSNDYILSCR